MEGLVRADSAKEEFDLIGRFKPPRCPACDYAMTLIAETSYGVKRYYECLRWLSEPRIHNEYKKVHPEEFPEVYKI